MNKPTLTTTKTKRMDRQEEILDKITIISAVLCAGIVIEALGYLINEAFGACQHSFMYNFIFGFGIIAGVAFIAAIFQEIFEK